MPTRRIVLVIACLALCPAFASAHPIKGVGDFYSGVLHPFTSLDFILPLTALSLSAGQQRREAAIAALGVFPLAVMAGAGVMAVLSAGSASSLHAPEWLGPAVMSAAGLCVALSWRAPALLAATLFTVCGVILGSTQGLEITSAISGPKFILGVGCTGLIVMAYGIGLVRRLQRPWAHIAVRVVGSWVAAAGFMVLALARN
jgi:urease accessory protein